MDPTTAIIIISFNCYDPSQDRFITTSMTVEFSVAGILLPAPPKIISYSLDQLKQTSSTALVVDGIQLFFCFCYLSRVFFLKLKIHKKFERFRKPLESLSPEEQEKRIREIQEENAEIDGYSPGCSIMTDLLVVIAFFLKFRYSQMTNYHDVDAILNDDYRGHGEEEYIELVHFADYYMEQYQMYTLIIILNIFNLVGALRIFRLVHWIMLIVERTFSVVGLFMMLLLPCQLGFSFLTYVFVGPYVQKYDSLIGGIKQQIITMMGQ